MCSPCKAAAEARAAKAARGYVYTDENGNTTKKATEVGAVALKIRNGNKGRVTPA